MSKAALPAKYGHASKADENHPLFPLYQQHRSNMSRLMVNSDDFQDWKYQYERNKIAEDATQRPEYPDFLKWMTKNKGGARVSPVGAFPHNFYYWCEGGRW